MTAAARCDSCSTLTSAAGCRLKLVSVLLSPETGPVVQEQAGSSDRRRDLLNALAAFQGERRASHARTSRVSHRG